MFSLCAPFLWEAHSTQSNDYIIMIVFHFSLSIHDTCVNMTVYITYTYTHSKIGAGYEKRPIMYPLYFLCRVQQQHFSSQP